MKTTLTIVLLTLLPSSLWAIGVVYTGVGGGGRQSMGLTEVTVDVRIQDRVAVTRTDQVFTNHSDNVVEGIYEFELPEGAVITDLVLWIEGQPVKGIIMEKEAGRRIYDAIVRRRIDPALVEQIDEARFRLSIFPFPERGTRRVELEYMQVLESREGQLDYSLPLAPETDLRVRIARFTLRAQVLGQQPFEVTAGGELEQLVDIQRQDELSSQVIVTAEELVPEENLRLTIRDTGVRQSPVVLSYSPSGSEQGRGYFALWVPPLQALTDSEESGRSITFVIDISSSMQGKRLTAVKAALAVTIDELDDGDLFNVIVFSNEARAYSSEPIAATAGNRADAVRFLNQQGALGLSNFEQAFRAAFSQSFPAGRVNQTIFLTDGHTTIGESDPSSLSNLVSDLTPASVRLFAIGVGDAVDRGFLRTVASDHQGEARFVSTEGDLEQALRSLFSELTHPVFLATRTVFSGTQVTDLFPREAEVLLQGREFFLVGRYQEGGDLGLRLEGMVGEEALTLDFPFELTREDTSQALIPRLWAHEKVKALDALIDRFGPNEELLDNILQLGLEHRLVTRRTSLFAPDESVVVNPDIEDEVQLATAATAVEESEATIVWLGKQFYLKSEVWVDVEYDPQMRLTTYDGRPELPYELHDFASFGQDMIVVVGDAAYRIDEGSLPATPVLSQNMPNPFNATTVIRMQIPMRVQVAGMRLTVHNLLGQVVRELALDGLHAGENRVVWDGRNDAGHSVATGIYIYRLAGPETAVSRRMLLLR